MSRRAGNPVENAVDAVSPDHERDDSAIAMRRGQKLEAWLARQKWRQADLARISGLTEMAISKYISGKTDIAAMRPTSVTKLLTAMHVSDTWAWKYFEIPEEKRSSWYSLRRDDMGPPQTPGVEADTWLLDLPAQGSGWMIPAGNEVTVDRTDRRNGLQVASVGLSYWILKREEQPQGAVLLGRFIKAGPAREASSGPEK